MIDFDPEKDAANIAKHGVSLRLAEALDLDLCVVVPDRRRDYGEDRWNAYGYIEEVLRVHLYPARGRRSRHQSSSGEAEGVEEMDVRVTWETVELDEDDAPELTEEIMARARPARDVMSEGIQANFKRAPGRPKAVATKKQVTLRLDADVIAHFRSRGRGWQSEINAALRSTAGLSR